MSFQLSVSLDLIYSIICNLRHTGPNPVSSINEGVFGSCTSVLPSQQKQQDRTRTSSHISHGSFVENVCLYLTCKNITIGYLPPYVRLGFDTGMLCSLQTCLTFACCSVWPCLDVTVHIDSSLIIPTEGLISELQSDFCLTAMTQDNISVLILRKGKEGLHVRYLLQ